MVTCSLETNVCLSDVQKTTRALQIIMKRDDIKLRAGTRVQSCMFLCCFSPPVISPKPHAQRWFADALGGVQVIQILFKHIYIVKTTTTTKQEYLELSKTVKCVLLGL